MSLRYVLPVLALLGCAPAVADDAPATKASSEQLSLEGYAAAAPLCLEWSDGCATCARDDDSAAHCSTPGIACQAGPIACRREKAK
jgi:hypothetical protein